MARHRQHSIVPLSRRSLIAVMTLTKIDKRGRLGSVLRSDLLGGIAGEMSPMRRLKLERAAQMTALAELARGDFMRDGKPTGQPAGARSPVRRHRLRLHRQLTHCPRRGRAAAVFAGSSLARLAGLFDNGAVSHLTWLAAAEEGRVARKNFSHSILFHTCMCFPLPRRFPQ